MHWFGSTQCAVYIWTVMHSKLRKHVFLNSSALSLLSFFNACSHAQWHCVCVCVCGTALTLLRPESCFMKHQIYQIPDRSLQSNLPLMSSVFYSTTFAHLDDKTPTLSTAKNMCALKEPCSPLQSHSFTIMWFKPWVLGSVL